MILACKPTFEVTQQHAYVIKLHGKSFVRMGEVLIRELSAPEQGRFVRQAGEQIQQHAQKMLAIAEQELKGECSSIEQHELAVKEHIQAIILYIQAMRELLVAAKIKSH